ncbi:MAG: hypothetical protein H0U74_05460 [Bradymonadaceae bacterium]|nr:hypothetical protein [Lujinxingiaceae bacterium]
MVKQAFSQFEFEDRILESLKKRQGVATGGDVSADTGLPLDETENVMRHMLTHYTSHLDVDDDGNLLYRFDPKLKRRGEDRARAWHKFKQKLWAAFTYFFKIWIMVTLVGYTALFLLLLLAVAIAGMAASASQDNNRGGGQLFLLPFHLFLRVLEFFFWISLFDGQRGGRGMGRGMGMGRSQRAPRKKTDKPVYQRIFDYVFGPAIKGDPLAAERAFAQFVRSRRGRITAAEWASRTGLSLEASENALTASVMRYSGDIDVSDAGTLVYTFDDLRVTVATDTATGSSADLPPVWQRQVGVAPLTGNKGSANTWISIFNGFNLTMSAVVLTMAAELQLAVVIGLGWVPLVFSLMFFSIPIIRSIQRKRALAVAEQENARRAMLEAVFMSAANGVALPVDAEALPDPQGTQFLNDFEGDVEVSEDGRTLYVFPRIAEQLRDATMARQAAAENVVFGKTVFSSDEEQLTLAESDLAEFDRRLARELGGEMAFDFDSVGVSNSSYAQVGKN